MSRRMSVSLTLDAVRERRKFVTRRHVDSWRTLKPGDHLTLIEKGMGLPKGAKQVIVAEVEVTHVRVEPIGVIDLQEVHWEGFPDMAPHEFVTFWLRSHGHNEASTTALCRRIEWRYLDGGCLA